MGPPSCRDEAALQQHRVAEARAAAAAVGREQHHCEPKAQHDSQPEPGPVGTVDRQQDDESGPLQQREGAGFGEGADEGNDDVFILASLGCIALC